MKGTALLRMEAVVLEISSGNVVDRIDDKVEESRSRLSDNVENQAFVVEEEEEQDGCGQYLGG